MAPETTPESDVFISYSSKDEEWVHGELLTRIEVAGSRALIDFRDFRPARSEHCRKTAP